MIVDEGLIFEKDEGIIDFPLRVAYSDSTEVRNTGRFVYLHWHKEFEFSIITEGSMMMEIDGKPLFVQEGDVIIIHPNEIHSSYCMDNINCRLFGIIFSMGLLNSAQSDACQTKYVDPFLVGQYKFPSLIRNVPGWQAEVVANVKRIIEVYRQKPTGFEIQIKASLYLILAEIISNKAFTTSSQSSNNLNPHIEKLQKSIEYMERHYDNRIYIEEVAEVSGLSLERFFKFFKHFTGDTPVMYLTRHRIRIASQYLKYSDLSVLDIALKTGFENVSYFIKTFKKHHGMTPHAFRKSGHNNSL
ncbi:AraC family transcriptional regulator [Paenibacillus roseipurpureus]|uniref:AraC family transcriptional regulator n=1 Tax=Paenibacillus roseopurpureus TaxID=2918901 RepID=A0AA96LTX9_9BACL|nr:AraC family transcriptional regulator [Paenibacillus sp. MBLB1832]WNR45973.1 AraC family transcriptional regulator [Paenibacillus sp. MBLB1832]